MNPKLHKERIRTSAQRPDIVIAFQNFMQHGASGRNAPRLDADESKHEPQAARTA